MSLKNAYYDPKIGYFSLDKFYRKMKEEDPEITRKQVKEFLDKQFTVQVNYESRKPKVYNTIMAPAPLDNYQMDIIIYDRYQINHYKYMLCVVDVNSRFAQVAAMTSRTNKTIVEKLTNICDKMGYPKNINCDNEFNKKELLDFFKRHDVTPHFSDVGELNKNAIVERFNRTIATLIQKWRVATKKRAWYKVLPDLVENYNSTYHRTIKAKPINVFEGKEKNHQKLIKLPPSPLKVGDQVRLKEVKPILGKGDYVKYSEDVYRITEIKGRKYYVENIRTGTLAKRPYKSYEIKKVSEIVTWAPEEQVQEEKEYDIVDDRQEEEIAEERRRDRRVRRETQDLAPAIETRRQRKPTERWLNRDQSNML